jgi:hypothetical protein
VTTQKSEVGKLRTQTESLVDLMLNRREQAECSATGRGSTYVQTNTTVANVVDPSPGGAEVPESSGETHSPEIGILHVDERGAGDGLKAPVGVLASAVVSLALVASAPSAVR